jgi:hypothetical protein
LPSKVTASIQWKSITTAIAAINGSIFNSRTPDYGPHMGSTGTQKRPRKGWPESQLEERRA